MLFLLNKTCVRADMVSTGTQGCRLPGGMKEKKEGNVLFNDALNTFYLRLYGIGHMLKDH